MRNNKLKKKCAFEIKIKIQILVEFFYSKIFAEKDVV